MRKKFITIAIIVMMLTPSIVSAEVTINNYANKQGETEILIKKIQSQLIDLLNQLIRKLTAELEAKQAVPVIIKEPVNTPEIIVNVVPQPQQITTTMPTEVIKKEILDINGFFKETDVDHKKVWIDNIPTMDIRIGFRKLARITRQGDIKLTVTGRFANGDVSKIIDTPKFGPGNDFDAVFTIPNTMPNEEYSFHLDINNASYEGSYDGKVIRVSEGL